MKTISYLKTGTSVLMFLLFSFCSNNQLYGQSWVRALTGNLDSLNFYDIQKDFYKYWEEKKQTEKDDYKVGRKDESKNEDEEKDGLYTKFNRWERFWENRINTDGSFPNPGYFIEERNKYFKQMKTKSSLTTDYKANWNQFLTTNSTGVGRIDCIAINPLDSNIIWAGSPSGGLWKSINGGQTWSTNTDLLECLGISDIVIDPQNPNIMYISTGTRDAGYGDIASIGVLKSIDGGNTWQETGLNDPYSIGTIKKLLINPSNTSILYAATKNGVWKTIDSGVTWTHIIRSGIFTDMALQPNNPNTLYAVSTYNGTSYQFSFYKSTNAGASFTQVTTGLPTGNISGFGNIRLATTVANSNYLYLLFSNYLDYSGLYLSTNAGNSFNLQSNSPNILGYSCSNPPPGDGQGWYDLAICVSPINENQVYVGGISIWKSSNAGINWSISGCWNYENPHADQHYLLFSPFNANKIYSGNDGGVNVNNILLDDWTNITNNIQTMQYYNLGISATNPNKIFAGSQDNGSSLYQNNNSFKTVLGGDALYDSKIDFSNENILYGNVNWIQYKSMNNGNSWNIMFLPDNYASFTFAFHPTNPQKLYAYRTYLYESTNRGDTWSTITEQDLINPQNGYDLKFSGNDSTIIYFINDENVPVHLKKTNLKTGKKTLIWDKDIITDYVVSQTDTNKIWVGVHPILNNPTVYQTNNGGITWTGISGSLPRVSPNAIIYENGSDDGLYIATDIGIFYKNASLPDWIPWLDGLPNVVVKDLDIQYGVGKIRAATFGRGIWEGSLYPIMPVANFSASKVSICQGDSVNFINSSSHYPTSWQWSFPGGNPAISNLQNPTVNYDSSGTYSAQLTVSNQAGSNTAIVR